MIRENELEIELARDIRSHDCTIAVFNLSSVLPLETPSLHRGRTRR